MVCVMTLTLFVSGSWCQTGWCSLSVPLELNELYQKQQQMKTEIQEAILLKSQEMISTTPSLPQPPLSPLTTLKEKKEEKEEEKSQSEEENQECPKTPIMEEDGDGECLD